MPTVYNPGRDAFIPQVLREQKDGLRPSFERILELVDQESPAWPAVAALIREMADSGVEVNEASIAIATKLGTQRWAERERGIYPQTPSYERLALVTAGPVVYYIRRAGLIKIGTSTDPRGRFGDLLPDEILAIEPGGHAEERARHRQFRHLRCQGEHFRDSPELLAHVKAIRDAYGDPDPSWPTSATVAAPAITDLEPPRSVELLTIDQAMTRLGIPGSTIRNWVRRGRLRRAGKEGIRYLYYLDDLMELKTRRCHKRNRC